MLVLSETNLDLEENAEQLTALGLLQAFGNLACWALHDFAMYRTCTYL